MKRVLAIALAFLASAALIFGAAFLRPAARSAEGQYKLGMGTEVTLDTSSGAKATVTTVAVITDSNGEIVDCVIDSGDFAISFEDVTAKKSGTYMTKTELGDSYGMVAYSDAKAEWYEQAKYFASYVVGMDANAVTHIGLTADGKGEKADITAGCTIAVSDFKAALVKAMGDTLAVSFTSDEEPVLSLAMINNDSIADADDAYPVDMVTDICAVASLEGKVLAAVTDAAESQFAYGTDGVLASALFGGTKREKLDGYGMKQYSGIGEEWYSQAEHFCEFIVGMDADEIGAVEMNDKGGAADADLAAGCTVYIGNFQMIAKKAIEAAE